MSETLNPKSESLALMPSENQWDTLKDEPFAGERNAEIYRPVGEMEKSEIAREYLDLLHDLSDNFTSPEAVNSAVVNPDGTVRDRRGYSGDQEFVKNLYQKNGLELDESNNLEELQGTGQNVPGEALHYENEDLDRAHTLKIVDKILSGEQSWRDAGEEYEKVQATLTSAVEKLKQLQTEQKSKGFFDRLKSALSFREQTKEINAIIANAQEYLSRAERKSQNSNQTLARSLGVAYSPDYHYGHHSLNYEHGRDQEYQEQINEEYNDKFFGADDPTRSEKINRAIELRKAMKL